MNHWTDPFRRALNVKKAFLLIFLLATATLLLASCSGQFGDFSVIFPYEYKYLRITSGYHVITKKNPVSGADVIYIDADVSLIGYQHPFIAGRVTTPSSLIKASNVVLGFFVLNVQDGEKQTGLKEKELSKKLAELEINEIILLSPREFASKKSPLINSRLLRIE